MLKNLKLIDSKLSIVNKVGTLTFCRNDIRNALTGSSITNDIINTFEEKLKSLLLRIMNEDFVERIKILQQFPIRWKCQYIFLKHKSLTMEVGIFLF